jgi:hypothetical protein
MLVSPSDAYIYVYNILYIREFFYPRAITSKHIFSVVLYQLFSKNRFAVKYNLLDIKTASLKGLCENIGTHNEWHVTGCQQPSAPKKKKIVSTARFSQAMAESL